MNGRNQAAGGRSDPKRADEVAAAGLCHRCGVCGGLCPAEALSFDGRALPAVSARCVHCGLCARVCSGWEFAFREAVSKRYWVSEKASPIGPFYNCALCRAADRGGRAGFVTEALVHLLRTGRVRGAVVTAAAGSVGRPRAFVARAEEDVRQAAGSKHVLFPWGEVLRDVMAGEGPVAFAGLPCQVHSLRKAAERVPGLADRIGPVFGLFCGANAEPVRAALARCAEDRVTTALLDWFHGQPRCDLCPDPSNVLADISVCEPPSGEADGGEAPERAAEAAVVVSRTREAWDLVREAAGAGMIVCREGEPPRLLAKALALASRKRRDAAAGMGRLQASGRPFPRFDFPALPRRAGWREAVRSAARSASRFPILRNALAAAALSPAGVALARAAMRRRETVGAVSHLHSGGGTA